MKSNLRPTPAAHQGTQGNQKPTKREAEAIEIKLEGDLSSPSGNPREPKANQEGGRGD